MHYLLFYGCGQCATKMINTHPSIIISMKGMHDLEKVFLNMMERSCIHVIPAPTRPVAHGCTAAWGFGFSAEPWSSVVDGWRSNNQAHGRGKKRERCCLGAHGMEVFFTRMLTYVCNDSPGWLFTITCFCFSANDGCLTRRSQLCS